ncbi:hypothetical protein ACF08B_36470 [Streptomyces sp. NPDC015139]|uniref:hypothetical protein n=1 Tax=Streptomyces sp. NPDC015139 TaxID=3364942 RepID=UPI0036F59AD8
MRWTDESGAVYGEDRYPGGYPYAYTHEYDGNVATDTATPPWDGPQTAPWPYPAQHAATPWQSPHGDVITAQLPAYEPAGPGAPEADAPASESEGPVFVDSSGRRQRRVARAARLLVIPAGGYVALLISAVLGGPTIASPFVPQAGSPSSATPAATAPDSARPAKSTKATAEDTKSSTAGPQETSPAGRSAAPHTPAAGYASTAAPATTAAPARTAAPTTTAAPAPSSRGRALGSSHRPAK